MRSCGNDWKMSGDGKPPTNKDELLQLIKEKLSKAITGYVGDPITPEMIQQLRGSILSSMRPLYPELMDIDFSPTDFPDKLDAVLHFSEDSPDKAVPILIDRAEEKRPDKDGWEYAGEVGVDSGQCWLGDPCYIMDEKHHNQLHNLSFPTHDSKDWKDVVAVPYDLGHMGLGVCVSSGFGDGGYPVYVKRKFGRIAEARVVFIAEDAKDIFAEDDPMNAHVENQEKLHGKKEEAGYDGGAGDVQAGAGDPAGV